MFFLTIQRIKWQLWYMLFPKFNVNSLFILKKTNSMTPMTKLSNFVVDEVRRDDMQVETYNTEAKEETNDYGVVNSSDFEL